MKHHGQQTLNAVTETIRRVLRERVDDPDVVQDRAANMAASLSDFDREPPGATVDLIDILRSGVAMINRPYVGKGLQLSDDDIGWLARRCAVGVMAVFIEHEGARRKST